MFGASQGGQASPFTGQDVASYAAELKLVGVAAAATASDLEWLFAGDPNGLVTRVLSAYTLDSWRRVYPQLRLDQVVTRVARPIVRRIASVCIAVDQKVTIAAGCWRSCCASATCARTRGRSSRGRARSRAAARAEEDRRPPVLITQGDNDKLVTPGITTAFVEELCRQGERVSYRTYPGVDHNHAGPDTAPDVRVDCRSVPWQTCTQHLPVKRRSSWGDPG